MRKLRNRWIGSGSGLGLGAILVLVSALGMTLTATADSTVPVGPSPDAVDVFLRIGGCNPEAGSGCAPPPPARAGAQSTISLGLLETSRPGLYLVTGISGFYSNSALGISGEITGLEPMDPSRVPKTLSFLPPAYTAAGFGYDNLVYPLGAPDVTATGPSEFLTVGDLLDEYGLAFDVAGGYTVDLRGGRSAPGAAGVYDVSDAVGSQILDNDAPVSVNVAPEPGSLVLVSTGLTGMAGMVRRRRWKGPRRSSVE